MEHILKHRPTKKIADVMKAKAGARLKPLKLTIFATFPDLNPQEIGTELV